MREAKIHYQRDLPHWHPPDTFLFVTCCLFGAMPRWRRPDPDSSAGEVFRATDRQLDAAKTGPIWLKDSRVAAAVVETLQGASTKGLCRIDAYVVMSNPPICSSGQWSQLRRR